MAADYIRNLREETRKGFYGRIKQGIYPLPAPLGYLDRGKGQPKELDPVKAPLVKQAFELYGSGAYSLDTLIEDMFQRGLRNKKGKRVTKTGFSVILNNPFYIGLIRLKRTGEIFQGAHESLISKSLFDRVQSILNSKIRNRGWGYDFLFRRLLTCKHCGYSMPAERQKGHIYYRCHSRACPITCVREEVIEEVVLQKFMPLQLSEEEKIYLQEKIPHLKDNWEKEQGAKVNALGLRLSQIQDRLNRLTDAYIDRLIEKDIFEERKTGLLMERKDVEEKLALLKDNGRSLPDRLAQFLELAGNAYLGYKMGIPEEKRDLLKIVTSNRQVEGKNVDLRLSIPFDEVGNRFQISNSAPYRDIPRTWDRLIDQLVDYFKNPSRPE